MITVSKNACGSNHQMVATLYFISMSTKTLDTRFCSGLDWFVSMKFDSLRICYLLVCIVSGFLIAPVNCWNVCYDIFNSIGTKHTNDLLIISGVTFEFAIMQTKRYCLKKLISYVTNIIQILFTRELFNSLVLW